MSTALASQLTFEDYEREARDCIKNLPAGYPVSHPKQAKQREITNAAFALMRVVHKDFHYFSRLRVNYSRGDELRRIAPDNIISFGFASHTSGGNCAIGGNRCSLLAAFTYDCFSPPEESRQDFCVFEKELAVPYYVLFYPLHQSLRLYIHNGKNYDLASPNKKLKYEIPELNIELALHNGWLRIWFNNELL